MLNAQQAEVAKRLLSLKDGFIRAARKFPAVFAAYVLRDESTQEPIVMAPAHIEWHEKISQHSLTAFISPVESGKSNQIAVARTLFELGANPNARCLIIGKSYDQARKNVSTVKQYIEESVELHDVFPHLRKGRRQWTESELVIERPGIQRDPSVRAVGINTEFQGSRLEWVVGDDLVTWANCLTQPMRDRTALWFANSVIGRLMVGAHVSLICNAQHPDDLLHRMGKPGSPWVFERYPVIRDDGTLLWPARWPRERIEQKRREMDCLGPGVAEKQLFCRVDDGANAEFKPEWIALALKVGNGMRTRASLEPLGPGEITFSGIDYGSGRANSDLYTPVTVLREPRGRLVIVNVEAGRWDGPEMIRRMIDTHDRYHSILVPEANGMQLPLIQIAMAQGRVIPINSFETTGISKEMGIMALKAALASGRIAIPNIDDEMDPEVENLCKEMRYYRRDAHTGDRMMALMMACWQASRNFDGVGTETSVTVYEKKNGESRHVPPPMQDPFRQEPPVAEEQPEPPQGPEGLDGFGDPEPEDWVESGI